MANTSSTVRQCVERLCNGEVGARAEIIAACMSRFRLLAKKMLKNYPMVRRFEDTDDLLQNAMVRLDRALQSVPINSKEDVYCLAATQLRRELIDFARYYTALKRPDKFVVPLAANGNPSHSQLQIDPSADSSASIHRLERWARFHEEIGHLPDADRQLFDLLWYQGILLVDVAEILGMAERTLKRRWREVKLRLSKNLDGEMPF